jgi:CubicO group peptidase (beta-lactamase class C family)
MTFILLFFSFQGTAVYPASRGDRSDPAGFIEKEMRRMSRRLHLPAFALTILDDQDILFQRVTGYTDVENQVPATTHSAFKVYSVSKTFTAMEIFREVEEGLIDLDDPITEYLPEFSIRSRFPDHTPITVTSLLAHRSGLPRNACLSCPPGDEDPFDLEKYEKATADCFLAFPTGSRYHYSNLGYNLLGRIIEETRDMGFSRYMKTHFLQDLGMEHSTFHVDVSVDSTTPATGYEYYKRKLYPIPQENVSNVPSGNLTTTLEDLSILLKALLNNKVFSRSTTQQQMYIDHYSRAEDPETMGLGLKTLTLAGGDLMLWHDGGPSDGAGALIAMVPSQKLAIAMVSNSTSFGAEKTVPLARHILNRLIEEKTNQTPAPVEPPRRIQTDPKTLEALEGKYVAWGMELEVEARNRKLKGRIGGLGLNLVPISHSEFKVTHWMDKIGLTKIIKPPVEFNKLRVVFPEHQSLHPDFLVINLNHISYEICPRYPDLNSLDVPWDQFPGIYQPATRLPGNLTGELWTNQFSIIEEDQMLLMSGLFGPIVPLDKNFLRILSGPFAGETMEYLPANGYIIHQNAVFMPGKE